MCIRWFIFLKVLQPSLSGSLGSLYRNHSLKFRDPSRETSTLLCINLSYLKNAQNTYKHYKKTMHEQLQSDLDTFYKNAYLFPVFLIRKQLPL